ncbi:MAG: hypothetical protein CO001_00865 [Candidatus Portnoybacteria bacterium CG_4_8_14_3_um_filter_40_10]|uniref:DUF5671 domain-containing protein n=4 Tax=Candidatus Portnoyibacteriota TaxID=1817913 RepID=A0A2M7IJ72_9BACT|nr:MAG: hypothetical protein COV84_01095 [Candidatus Portnoybacteria bacterium CG11_big_fil_rev_8_21_14_0_20_40_15]PIS30023.1 MAG: hypothetical protein COT41_03845 [Candidatus Portnoybacteria bacterium CG08_land_8_20_14_0_20_40_83]PIW76508.1 MAG: hypothetical protein CO001_00865 [Candidatus Portnoybacteria bacterium CG_4_8_14_3_um_filter_40_10]PIY74054.1 MAG: hypothetical protein COY85_04320 [Candidatus Portnoybacteria bacterium CG_4_10_14_0_8_um_filter_40_50]PJA64975.1 MAG: hypothetical protei
MPTNELLNFIKQSQSAGQTDEKIKAALRSAGWQESDIEEGFKSLKPQITLPTAPPMQTKGVQNYSDVLYRRPQNIVVKSKISSRKKSFLIFVISLLLAALGTAVYFYKLADMPFIKNFLSK